MDHSFLLPGSCGGTPATPPSRPPSVAPRTSVCASIATLNLVGLKMAESHTVTSLGNITKA